MIAAAMPFVSTLFQLAMFTILAAKPSIGQKKPGHAFSEERLQRDWIEIGIMKLTNMVRGGSATFILPVP